jgi:hypothetical protein
MSTGKLLDRLKAWLDDPPEKSRLKQLRRTVKALKQKQRELEVRLDKTEGKHARHRLEHKIRVLKKQRSKGAALYRELKH